MPFPSGEFRTYAKSVAALSLSAGEIERKLGLAERDEHGADLADEFLQLVTRLAHPDVTRANGTRVS
jgi:hypothetical protein